MFKIHTSTPAPENKKKAPTKFSAGLIKDQDIALSSKEKTLKMKTKTLKKKTESLKKETKKTIKKVRKSSTVIVAAVTKEVKTDRQSRYAARQSVHEEQSLTKKAPDVKEKRKAYDDVENDSQHLIQQVIYKFLYIVSL